MACLSTISKFMCSFELYLDWIARLSLKDTDMILRIETSSRNVKLIKKSGSNPYKYIIRHVISPLTNIGSASWLHNLGTRADFLVSLNPYDASLK